MCPFQCTTLHHSINSPEAHNTHMAGKRQSVQEKSYGAVKGPIIDYRIVKEIEQESSCIYGMKGQSLEGKQTFWLPPAILSQSKLKCGKYILLSKGFDTLEGRGDSNERTTTQEKPMGAEYANYIQDWRCDNFGNPLLQGVGLRSMRMQP